MSKTIEEKFEFDCKPFRVVVTATNYSSPKFMITGIGGYALGHMSTKEARLFIKGISDICDKIDADPIFNVDLISKSQNK